ncbi:MAG: malate dehydrogenase [Candidatus Amoebophilus sp. 36-38]|nr:MAG: malate dehydrogenase [Candidatus Amoebophilus sp. 36-38]
MSIKITKEAALEYHAQLPAGKLGIHATKPLETQYDLSLAYSPGVAFACQAIAEDKRQVYTYTAKSNLVAVISNGTAILGLGNLGPEAAKPVMEGKSILLKKFAGIDSFDIEIDATDPSDVVHIIKALAPTFGGINLEDFKAPECFEIEQELKKQLSIPVMHDDQHGTAMIAGAALKNALLLVNKKIGDVQVVMNGAGAGAIACAKLIIALGVKREYIVMCDSQGVIRKDREGLEGAKTEFATDRPVYTLAEALKGADVFLGLSKGNVLQPEGIRSMAEWPIVFALANPNPEIDYDLALSVRKDIIMATGRSDYPNQINNVLGFPYIFRGALDVWATAINEEMKLAVVEALVELAQKPVPDQVKKIYGLTSIEFGPTYLLPKPFDKRLITTVAPAVAQAAIKSGVAQKDIQDWEAYKNYLRRYVETA